MGGNLAVLFKKHYPDVFVIAFDNLSRRGSELSPPRLKEHGVEFIHGDIRCSEDLEKIPDFDLLLDCSAEPSVHAGAKGSPLSVIQHNLTGAILCMEAARKRDAAFLFLSSSRVYPIRAVNDLPFREDDTRFVWEEDEFVSGFSAEGVGEEFPLEGARSFYGTTKLAGELLLREYAFGYGMPVMIDRCGIITGPWQMGKVDQGVVALWVASHVFGKDLSYIGFGGEGKQVRDMLHVEDLFDLLVRQMSDLTRWDGARLQCRRRTENLLVVARTYRNVPGRHGKFDFH